MPGNLAILAGVAVLLFLKLPYSRSFTSATILRPGD